MEKTLTIWLAVIIMALSPIMISAQEYRGIDFLKKRDFGRYFISDIYSPRTSVAIGFGWLADDYNIDPGRQNAFALFSETSIGTELPLFEWKIGGAGSGHKLAVSFPLSVNFLMDMAESSTHPIINTEYRIGTLEINYLYDLQFLGIDFIRNAGLKFIPFFHESSHIGDEITIYRKDAGLPITRVNPTGNTAELSLVLNDENGSQANNHSFKAGTRIIYFEDTGFYTMRPEEGDTSKITHTSNRFEWYGQYQWNGSSGFIKNPRISTVFSLELRNRVLFDYPYYNIDPKSSIGPAEFNSDRKHVPSFNGYVGWRYRPSEEKPSYLGLYLRFYLGANPHGQFRNIPTYRYYALSLVYEN